MELQETTRGNRLHIGIFGRRNAGKSSLVNVLTGQQVAVVSEVAGTTTDPVYKAMEWHGLGPVVLIDTAGFDDTDEALGALRVEKTQASAEKADLAVLVFSAMPTDEERAFIASMKARKVPMLAVVTHCDTYADGGAEIADAARAVVAGDVVRVVCVAGDAREMSHDAKDDNAIRANGDKASETAAYDGVFYGDAARSAVREALVRILPADFAAESLTGALCHAGDTVLLVMPQDLQAPQGRLILPQVQTIRELLDKSCLVVAVTVDGLGAALSALREPPALIVTDSQVFGAVYAQKPPSSRLTSFSVLMAAYKGDIDYFVASARAIDTLAPNAHILIAEACTHEPIEGDIGRVKIPAALRKKLGDTITVDFVRGADFPQDLSGVDLIIHCGACMFNRRLVLSRVARAQAQGVPMTNYGIVLAKMAGILAQVALP